MTLGTRVAAFDAEGRVFLVRHTYVAGWHLPGGGVDPGETCEAAARRELAEEASVPPYVIFHDSTLLEMVRQKPRDPYRMGQLPGVGTSKLDRYGDAFLAVIRQTV